MMTPCSRCIHCPPTPSRGLLVTLEKEGVLEDWEEDCEAGEPTYLKWYSVPSLNLWGCVVAPRRVDPNKCQGFTPARPPNRFDKILRGDDYLFGLE
jgi:hypothetical protein